jgi:hypothetical protein
MDSNTTTITDAYNRREVKISWDKEGSVTSVTLFDEVITSSYLEGGRVVIAHDLDGELRSTILPMSREEVEGIVLTGGWVRIYADDLFVIKIYPSWWGVEHEMAGETCPPWPLCEEDVGGEQSDSWGLIGLLMNHIMEQEPPPDEDEGGDFV